MAVTGTVTISGGRTSNGYSVDTLGPFTLTNADSPIATTTQSFALGAYAAITLPPMIGSAAIKRLIIVPAPTNAGVITLKGVTGDTGIPLHKTEPTVLSVDTSTFSGGLLCAALTVMTFYWY